jgi:hypothetical protein
MVYGQFDSTTLGSYSIPGIDFSSLDLSRDFAAGVYLSEVSSPPRFLFWVVEPERSEGLQFTKLGLKYQHDNVSPVL